MSKDAKQLFLHTWERAECYMFIHHSTGLKFCCDQKRPTPDDPDNWNIYIIDVHADQERIASQAEQDGTSADEYVEYLASTAMEMADKALLEKLSRR